MRLSLVLSVPAYNFLPFFKREAAIGPRHEIFYFDDSANMNALRYDDWKITFQVIAGNMFNGRLVAPNMPFVVNLREDLPARREMTRGRSPRR